MRLLLLPKWDQPCAKRISWQSQHVLPTEKKQIKIAVCYDCKHDRQRRECPSIVAGYFEDLFNRYLERNTEVICLQVTLLSEDSGRSLRIIETADIFYMGGGDPGQRMPRDLQEVLKAWHTVRDQDSLASSQDSVQKLNMLYNRVLQDELLYMGICMGAMMAGETYGAGPFGSTCGERVHVRFYARHRGGLRSWDQAE